VSLTLSKILEIALLFLPILLYQAVVYRLFWALLRLASCLQFDLAKKD
jgi:hypothetical protein